MCLLTEGPATCSDVEVVCGGGCSNGGCCGVIRNDCGCAEGSCVKGRWIGEKSVLLLICIGIELCVSNVNIICGDKSIVYQYLSWL